MTKKLIAGIVGTSTETAIRVLSRWKKRDIIGSRRGHIRLHDPTTIIRISQGHGEAHKRVTPRAGSRSTSSLDNKLSALRGNRLGHVESTHRIVFQ